MKFKVHHKYLISVEIPILYQLKEWKEPLIRAFYNTTKEKDKEDLNIDGDEWYRLRQQILPPISQVAHKLFYNLNTDISPLDNAINVYIQGNELWDKREEFIQKNETIHNHKEGNHTHSLCGVTYLDIPLIGGEFQTIEFPGPKIFTIKPEIGRFYFFPSWLYHRPLPHKDDMQRICINWNAVGDTIPILKIYNKYW